MSDDATPVRSPSRRTFYCEWLKRVAPSAFSGAEKLASSIAFLSVVAGILIPSLPQQVSAWATWIGLAALGIVFAWRFIAAPFEIWREKADELERLKSRLQTVERQRQLRSQLGVLHDRGQTIHGQVAYGQDFAAAEQAGKEWMTETFNLLSQNFDEGVVATFQSYSGILPAAPNILPERIQFWQVMRARLYQLQRIIDSLPVVGR